MTLGSKPRGSEITDQKSTLPCRHSGVEPAPDSIRAGIQVTDSVRHTVEKRYLDSRGRGRTPVFTGVTIAPAWQTFSSS